MPEFPDWFGHDAAAVLVENGQILCAIEEERINRIKHTNRFPHNAIRACLSHSGRGPEEIDAIAYCFEEWADDKELGLLYAANPDVPVRRFRELLLERLAEALALPVEFGKLHFVRHHEAHAMAAYLHSGFSDALVAVIDGSGEEDSTSLYSARGQELNLLRRYSAESSLGIFYRQTIETLGYRMFDEYKVMGLAPLGNPDRFRALFNRAFSLGANGQYTLTPGRARSLLIREGFIPRRRGEALSQDHADVAASLQESLEVLVEHILDAAKPLVRSQNLCIAGGVALNCTLNGRLARSDKFNKIFVHPAAHDAGAAMGAALKVDLAARQGLRTPKRLQEIWLGPRFDLDEPVTTTLERWSTVLDVRHMDAVEHAAADCLAAGGVIGWFQGRSEFGPRALGNRSILADPRPVGNKDRVNGLIKRREGFRPFAPSVTEEEANRFFDIPVAISPLDFMTTSVHVKTSMRALLGAVTHVDGTARVQSVRRETNPLFHALLVAFGKRTGVPVLLNTSFNNMAEPIVHSTEDAIQCFLSQGLDRIYIDQFEIRLKFDRRELLKILPAELSPWVILETTKQPNQPPVHAVKFDYSSGRRRVVSSKLFEALTSCDGSLPLLTAAIDDSRFMVEAAELWENRFVTLKAPANRGNIVWGES